MRNTVFVAMLLFIVVAHGQKNLNWFINSKEFTKDKAVASSKQYLFKEILGTSDKTEQFQLDALAASNSLELTTLYYKSDVKNKEGLILAFYGSFWNENGTVYEGYSFKNLSKEQAIEFLGKIQKTINDNYDFIRADINNNNVYFTYEGIDVLIWLDNVSCGMRLFWNGFDAGWNKAAFDRTKRRFESKVQ